MGWVSPTGHNDPSNDWDDEAKAYNGNTGNWAQSSDVPLNEWTGFLELTHAALDCNKVQVYVGSGDWVANIDLDVYYDSDWHHVYQGISTDYGWMEKPLGGTYSVTALRIRLYNRGPTADLRICDVDFWEVEVIAPTVTTQAVTDIQPTTATGHGNITATGGENCTKRGVCWNTGGNPTVADSKSEETGSFGTGAFTRPMTGLTPGQHYYVKAYAYNSAGYGYGSQVEFTASKLLQPTGIASAEAFGALTVVPGAVSVLPTAIGSLEAFGSAKLNLKLILTGIASAEAFGTPIVISGLTIYPSAMPSAEAFGAPIIAGPILVTGIASGEQFGTPIVTPGGVIVAPTGISSEELFGLPKLNVFVTPSGIVTSEALGTAKLNLKLILSGIASAEAFGTPTVEMILVIRPSGIASVELFGTPLLIVILAGGDGMKLPTTKGQVSIPSKEVSI